MTAPGPTRRPRLLAGLASGVVHHQRPEPADHQDHGHAKVVVAEGGTVNSSATARTLRACSGPTSTLSLGSRPAWTSQTPINRSDRTRVE